MTFSDNSAPLPSMAGGTAQLRRRNSPRRQRLVSRWIHLVAAAVLGTYVYAPVELVEPFRLWLQIVVIPLAGVSGLLLWQQARIRRWWTRLIAPLRDRRS